MTSPVYRFAFGVAVEPGKGPPTRGGYRAADKRLASARLVAVGSHDTASAVAAVPADRPDFAYISCGTWSLVGLELEAPVHTEASRAANFANELGLDGTVRYLRNVMGLWLLQESVRTWQDEGEAVDLPALITAAARVPALGCVIDVDDAAFLPPGDMPARIAAAVTGTGQPVPQSPAEMTRCILDSLALPTADPSRAARRNEARRCRTEPPPPAVPALPPAGQPTVTTGCHRLTRALCSQPTGTSSGPNDENQRPQPAPHWSCARYAP
ncbi:FGGY-family carbohydrate kinase [Georgenia sp. AZ-5]|uniref:FGGY-family carbohydrate kinase n=1 Tax=Georgenia sp. AZ-5 TaxID=3367526 RepID=UPI0037550AF5